MMTVDGFYTVPKDRANWLFDVDLDALGVKWVCLRRYGCYALSFRGMVELRPTGLAFLG